MAYMHHVLSMDYYWHSDGLEPILLDLQGLLGFDSYEEHVLTVMIH